MPIVLKSGNLNLLEPSGPVQACNGIALSFTVIYNKSKRIPSIFNDKSTESFICLRRHIYMSHVNKVQPINVIMICISAIRVTSMKDFVSVVKILLKAFFFCSLFPYPHPTIRAPYASSYSASPNSFLQQATPHL
jgi:hypothetical protein